MEVTEYIRMEAKAKDIQAFLEGRNYYARATIMINNLTILFEILEYITDNFDDTAFVMRKDEKERYWCVICPKKREKHDPGRHTFGSYGRSMSEAIMNAIHKFVIYKTEENESREVHSTVGAQDSEG